MTAAKAWGVPHSELLGRVVMPGQARWTDRDRVLALALLRVEARTHECGHLIVESFDAANEDKYEATALRCWACAEGQAFARTFEGDTAGLAIQVRKVDDEC